MRIMVVLAAIVLLCQSVFADKATAVKTVPPGLIFELLALNGDLETVQKPKYLSPSSMAVSPDKKCIYITEQTAKQIDVFTVATNTVTKSIKVPNEPTGIAVSAEGDKMFVTCSSERWPSGMLFVIDAASGLINKKIPVGHMARSPVLSPDGSIVYVCNWLENTISFVDITSGKETKRVPAIKEPYSVAVSKDGKFLIVANMIPDGVATDTTMACKVCFINTSTGKIDKTIKLPNGSHSTMNITLTPDGKYAFIPHLIGRVNLPATTLEQGWVHSNNLAIVDMETQTLYNDVELDDSQNGYANPWNTVCTDDGKWLCVAYAGYDVVTIIDLPGMLKKLVGKGDVSHEFTFIRELKKNVITQVKSARSIVAIGSKIYVTGIFSQSINSIDVNASTLSATKFALADEKAITAERKGEALFYDANLCVGHWQSCHSCHPFTRPDGLNWILSDSYLSAPKNVKSMLMTFQTPPTNWACKRDNAFESVRSGIRLELQIEPTADVSLALDTFLMRLKPVPSPKLVKGKLSTAAEKGKQLYNDNTKTDCSYCHPAPLFTDLKRHNSGTVDNADPTLEWDSPSIIECWRTAPYNHIGSHETIEDNLKQPGHSKKITTLSQDEFDNLVQYILSL